MAEVITEEKKPVATVETVKEDVKSPEPKASPLQAPKVGEWVEAFVKGEVGKEETPKVEPAKVEPTKAEATKDESKKAEVKAEEKPKVEAKAEPKADPAKLEKQLKDTRDFSTRVQQQNVELGRKLDLTLQEVKDLKAKMDGTYEEPKAPDTKQVEQKAVDHTKLAASHYAAVELFKAQGMDDEKAEAEVQALVWKEDAPFQALQKDPAVLARVLNAKLPVLEAIKVVREAEARRHYGDSPEAMRATIEKELQDKFDKQLDAERDKIRHAVLEEVKGGGKPKRETVAGLSGVRGATKEESTASDDTLNFNSLFGPTTTRTVRP